MPNKKITLKQPLLGHQALREIELKEPTWRDFSELGDPFVWTPRGDGYVVASPIMESVKAYAERLFVIGDQPGDPLLLNQLCLADARAVKDAVISFFLDDEKASEASKTSSTTSSLSSDGDLEISPA